MGKTRAVLLTCAALVVGAVIWEGRRPTMQKLSERAASAQGVAGKAVRSFIRERLTDLCGNDAERTRITQLSASDCAVAVERKDMLCSAKMQIDREEIIHSEEDFRSYSETYVECIYPDNTNYVGPNSSTVFPRKRE